jgi:hypothetical protein
MAGSALYAPGLGGPRWAPSFSVPLLLSLLPCSGTVTGARRAGPEIPSGGATIAPEAIVGLVCS